LNGKINEYKGEVYHTPLMNPFFFPFLGGGGEFFFFFFLCSQCLPNMFPSSSLEVPQVPKFFPKAFPIAPQFYPIWFCLELKCHVYKLKGRL